MLKKRVLCNLLLIISFMAVTEHVFANWKPAENTIMTKWAEKVTPENAWQEYPRPQLVRKEWKNLNGLWDYSVLKKASPAPKDYQGEILVPFCVESALSGVKKTVMPDDRIWYHRTFEVPSDWSGKKVILNFEAVDWETAVWINGVYVGSHKGAYDRFSFDITDCLKKTGKQECVVSVWDPSSYGTQARGKQQMPQRGIWYTPVSGIWQTVWLEAIPMQTSIKEIKITPDIDTKTVTICPMLIETFTKNYQVEIDILDGDKVIANSSTKGNKPVTIKIDNPKLWSPDTPFLYDLKLKLINTDNSEQTIDELTSYFGMRKISLGDGPNGKYLYLNNKPLFHYGTLDQGWWPDGLHTPPSDEAMKYDIEITKQMGFNMIRKHIKVEPARWFYWCDKLGIMVWQDMPSAMQIVAKSEDKTADIEPSYPQQIWHNNPDQQRNSEFRAQFEWELNRMIDIHYNSPSIVMWVPFNEGWGQYDTFRITDMIKGFDPTRLVNPVSGWTLRDCGDVYDIHTYGETLDQPVYQKDRATVVGEFGGIGYVVKDHIWNPKMRNWGYQSSDNTDRLMKDYVHKFNQIVEMEAKGLSGAVYTQTTDVEGEINGLMTYDRKVIKLDPKELNKIHSVLYK